MADKGRKDLGENLFAYFWWSLPCAYTVVRVGIEDKVLNTKYIRHLPAWYLVVGGRCVNEKKAEGGKKHEEHNHQEVESSGESVREDSKRKLGPFPKLAKGQWDAGRWAAQPFRARRDSGGPGCAIPCFLPRSGGLHVDLSRRGVGMSCRTGCDVFGVTALAQKWAVSLMDGKRSPRLKEREDSLQGRSSGWVLADSPEGDGCYWSGSESRVRLDSQPVSFATLETPFTVERHRACFIRVF